MSVRWQAISGHLRTTNGYFTAKENVSSFLNGVPVIGAPIKSALQNSKKSDPPGHVPFHDVRGYGFSLFWLIDGHDEPELERIFQTVCAQPGPTLLHVVTKKGKGYAPAESNPGNYHAFPGSTRPASPTPRSLRQSRSRVAFGRTLSAAGNTDKTSVPLLPP